MILITCATGCADGTEGAGSRVATHQVTGKVTKGGSPVIEAAVVFSPRGDQPAAFGKTNSSGEYELTTYDFGDGAAEGEYNVTVTEKSDSAAEDPAHSTDANSEIAGSSHAAEGGGGGSGHGGGHSGGGSGGSSSTESSSIYKVNAGDNVINIEL